MVATSYLCQKDLSRVKDYDPAKTYRAPFETGTGYFKPALARFGEDGWEYLHMDYDRWLPIPDEVEIWTFD